jgi:hypothetical protein
MKGFMDIAYRLDADPFLQAMNFSQWHFELAAGAADF